MDISLKKGLEQDCPHSSLFKMESSPSGFIWSNFQNVMMKNFPIYWSSKWRDDQLRQRFKWKGENFNLQSHFSWCIYLERHGKSFFRNFYPPSCHYLFYLELRQVHWRWCTAPTHLKLCSTFQVSGWDKVSGSSEMYSFFFSGT